ncbi:unnamed protein product [Bursaphelenchus xylophilus]|uniref:(pine wood nematode) hypothetical protein n=1 Tax=Bursaphelenchus xylophilus TaxID=6326 RepID=A0A7I8XIB2_BURXY|nr:unnamed protein product [Bursaphelenchus xylophilus]CAG9085456.1 unnamed protein product [Bursaphelenchus xylophilus]
MSLHGFRPNRSLERSDYTYADLLQGSNPSDRLKIAEESMNKWGLIAKADEVLKSFNEDKKTFGRVDLEFAKETEDLNTYVKDLKVNLMDLFESKNVPPRVKDHTETILSK